MEIFEKPIDSRDFSSGEAGQRRKLLYNVTGSDDEQQVLDYARANTSAERYGIPRTDVSGKEIQPGIWEVTVSYETTEEDGEGGGGGGGDGLEIGFDTTGGTDHITQSINTTIIDSNELHAPDFQGAIGVVNGKVEGVDVLAPALKFHMSGELSPELVTLDYVKTLARVTGTTNAGAWNGFAEGELLFAGARGVRNGPNWSVSYEFIAAENIEGLEMEGFAQPIDKKGHEYIWFLYEDTEDEEAKFIVKKPISAYVEQVYRKTDFGQLGGWLNG